MDINSIPSEAIGNYLELVATFEPNDRSRFWDDPGVESWLDYLDRVLSTEAGHSDLYDIQNATFDASVYKADRASPPRSRLLALHMPNPVAWKMILPPLERALAHASCVPSRVEWRVRDWRSDRLRARPST